MVLDELPMKTYTVPIWLEEIYYQKRWTET